MYTDEGEVPLREVLNSLKKKEKGQLSAFDYKKASREELASYFAEILPNYDRDRVYPADIKKLVSWYNLLVKAGMTDFDEGFGSYGGRPYIRPGRTGINLKV